MVRDWYFYLNKGKAVGPIDRAGIKSAIDGGQIGPFDLLFREGDDRWQPIHEFAEFKGQLKGAPKPRIEEVWVVLQREETRKGLAYLQRGPFTTKQVKDQLQAGEIQYRDFIWQEGQRQWSRISANEVFNPPPVQWKPTNSLPQDVDFDDEITADHLIDEVAQQSHVEPYLDPVPPEASTPDLTEEGASEPPAMARSVPRPFRQPTARIPVQRRPNVGLKQWPIEGARRFSLKWISGGVVGLALVVFLASHRQEILKRFGIQVTEVEEVADLPKPPAKGKSRGKDAPVVEPPAPTPTAELKVEPPPSEEPLQKVVPKRLSVEISGNSTSNPQANFSTDGSIHYPIRVLVVGEAGDVLGRVSVYREVTVRWNDKESPRLDLGTMELGNGRYRLVATVVDQKAVGTFRLGPENREFKEKLERHRKLISLPFQRERRRYIQAARGLGVLGEKLLKASSVRSGISRDGLRRWKSDYDDWVKVRISGLALDDPKGLVFPGQWQSLKTARQSLFDIYKSLEKDPKAGKAQAELKSLSSELSDLEAAGQKLSLFP